MNNKQFRSRPKCVYLCKSAMDVFLLSRKPVLPFDKLFIPLNNQAEEFIHLPKSWGGKLRDGEYQRISVGPYGLHVGKIHKMKQRVRTNAKK